MANFNYGCIHFKRINSTFQLHYQYVFTHCIILSDLNEGHYKFRFKNDVSIDQFYVHSNREFCDDKRLGRGKTALEKQCRTENPSFRRDLNEKIIEKSWNPNSTIFVEPINLTYQNQIQTNLSVDYNFEASQLDTGFRTCYDYHEKYHHYDDEFPLEISLNCSVMSSDECLNCFCSCNWKHATMSDNMTLTLSRNNCKSINNKAEPFINSNMRVNLVCIIIKPHVFGIAYGFNQPLNIKIPTWHPVFNDTSSTSDLVDTKTADSSNIPVGIVILILIIILFGVSASLFIYCCMGRRNEVESLAIDINNTSKLLKVKWTNNQDYVSVNSEDNDECNDNIGNHLPNWLKTRPELIYDSSCIEKGEKLGSGNFGAVFEGKIRFGNAM